MRARPVAAATVLWAVFVAALQVDGTWQRLGPDLFVLSAFACGFALLTYAVDAEARGTLEGLPARVLLVTAFGAVVLAAMAPLAVAVLLALPSLAVAIVALTRRAVGNRGWPSRPTSIP